MRDLGPSDSLIFLAEGSDAPAYIPVSDITSVNLRYTETESSVAGVFTVTRHAVLVRWDGQTIQGILPGHEDLAARAPHTIGLDLETSPYIIKKLDLQQFISPYFPRLTDAERVVSMEFRRRSRRNLLRRRNV
jgi:hypothetical protein